MKKLTHQSNWMGGKWLLDGEPFWFDHQPKAEVVIKRKRYPVVYQDTHGVDHDHGHEYGWSRTDPGIIDGVVVPRFLNLMTLLKHRYVIRLELL